MSYPNPNLHVLADVTKVQQSQRTGTNFVFLSILANVVPLVKAIREILYLLQIPIVSVTTSVSKTICMQIISVGQFLMFSNMIPPNETGVEAENWLPDQ